MSHIINTTTLQIKTSEIISYTEIQSFIITKRGEAKAILLPYYEGTEEWIEDYMEDYKMYKNRDKLEEELEKSLNSGESDLTI